MLLLAEVGRAEEKCSGERAFPSFFGSGGGRKISADANMCTTVRARVRSGRDNASKKGGGRDPITSSSLG